METSYFELAIGLLNTASRIRRKRDPHGPDESVSLSRWRHRYQGKAALEYGRRVGIEAILGRFRAAAFLGTPNHGGQHPQIAPLQPDVGRAFHAEARALSGSQLGPPGRFCALRRFAVRPTRVHSQDWGGPLVGVGVERTQSQPAQVVQPGGSLELHADLG